MVADYLKIRAERLGLEPLSLIAGSGPSGTHRQAYDEEVAMSQAISLKRIADLMEPVNVQIREEDIERDPLMIIARAIEELARPTLPAGAEEYRDSMLDLAERSATADERAAEALANLCDALREGGRLR